MPAAPVRRTRHRKCRPGRPDAPIHRRGTGAVLARAGHRARGDRAAAAAATATDRRTPWLIPALEGAAADRHLAGHADASSSTSTRAASRGARDYGVRELANSSRSVALTHFLLHHKVANGRELIISGVLIWLTNFLIFALWYWELDRGGPGRRAAGHDAPPDFLFPQMADDRIEPLDWRPQFIDYLYVSLTNATAFSPPTRCRSRRWRRA